MGLGLRGNFKSKVCLWCNRPFNSKSDRAVELAETYDNEPVCKECIQDYVMAELQGLEDYLKTTADVDPYGDYPTIKEELLGIRKIEYILRGVR